jgi:hypothetical protein
VGSIESRSALLANAAQEKLGRELRWEGRFL